jgi:hypothetical protein
MFIGPLLILIGMVHSDLLRLNRFYKDHILNWFTTRYSSGFGAFPMGILIALSFCPASAAIFFGVLIPIAIRYEQPVIYPLIYAFGASYPLILISISIVRGTRIAGVNWLQRKLPQVSGYVMILAGLYISIVYIYIPLL